MTPRAAPWGACSGGQPEPWLRAARYAELLLDSPARALSCGEGRLEKKATRERLARGEWVEAARSKAGHAAAAAEAADSKREEHSVAMMTSEMPEAAEREASADKAGSEEEEEDEPTRPRLLASGTA